MRFTSALEQSKWHIVSLYGVIIVLVMICLGLILGWHSSQSNLTIHYPPEIPTTGLTIKANAYPKAQIFGFTYYIWQSINHWPKNGAKDYQKNIKQFSAFLTPKFKDQLVKDFNHRYENGELQDRIRTMQGMNGTSFNPQNVRYLGDGVWLVHVAMRLTERMNNNGNPVKDIEMDYTFKVVRYQVDARKNQWGLALAGFAVNPDRIKTYV